MKNKKIYCIFAPRRSGQHAIINWICNGLKKEKHNVIHLNDIKLYGNPYLKCKDRKQQRKYKTDTWQKIHNNIDYLFINYEDEILHDIKLKNIFGKNKTFHKNVIQENIIILRDPFNNFASKIRYSENKSRKYMLRNIVEVWKSHAKEYLTISNNIKNKIVINYNNWFISQDYRKQIANLFKFNDYKAYLKVSKSGNGSSFDQRSFDGKANEMKVLQRWEAYKTNMAYLALVNDRELIDLYEKIFKPLDGISKYIKF